MIKILVQTMMKWSAGGVCLASKQPNAVQWKLKQERDEERPEVE